MADIGYLNTRLGAGDARQADEIVELGHNAISVTTLTPAQLAALDVLVLETEFGGPYPPNWADVLDAVSDGLVLFFNDWLQSGDPNALFAGTGIDIRVITDSHDVEMNLGRDGALIASTPYGTVTDTSIDNGTSSNHGYVVASSLPPGAKILMTRDNPDEVTAFSFPYGSGTIIYTTAPAVHYSNADPGSDNAWEDFAVNMISYAASLAVPAETVANDDTATTTEPVAVQINVLANDTDLQGDTLRVTHVEGIAIRVGQNVTLASGSTVRLAANGNLVFTPGAATNAAIGPGQSLVETFSYTISDAATGGNTDVGSVSVTVNGAYNPLIGTAADNAIFATDASEEIKGLAGNDRLYARGGNDLIDGGTGADVMSGGDGDDTYIVDNLGDVVSENVGAGTDKVLSSVSFTLSTDVENLTLTGGASINGTGNGLANQIIGNGVNNVLSGGQGADTIFGGGGIDTLNGGLQADRLKGGSGADTFLYSDQADSSVARGSVDVIYDYSFAERDRIDLSGVDASTRAMGDQDFVIVDNLTGTAGQMTIRTYGQMATSYENGAAAGTTYGYIIEGDTNGDRVADFTLLVNSATQLTVAQLSTGFIGLAGVTIDTIYGAAGGPATAQTTIPDLFA
ncbi:hypothetical protein GVN21_06010 [Caulobacter sp. SLTY]|uniref:calcium-binding protein n=1 Tax=Caulobacter sp. SLTY TaxID=2683262 RepID=UPI00196ACAF6|nr:Ig-like domain-containing protein [Caulobacter sp. SLTY]NBB14917.1 hypothetical protein [Caulobacter sp. SLTY]